MFKNIIFKICAVSLSLTLILSSCSKEEKTLLGTPSVTAEIGKHAITVTWPAVPNASAYTYRFNGSTAVSTTATSLKFDDLTAGTDYEFALKAVCQDGSYEYSQETSYVFSTPAEKVTLSAEVTKADFGGITISFDSSEDIDHVNWYLGSEFTASEDLAAFVTGAVTEELPEQSGTFTVTTKNKLQIGKPAVIYMQAVSFDGNKSDIVTLKATAAPIVFTPSYISLGSFVATVGESKDSEYIGMGIFTASAEEIDFYTSLFGMSVNEVFMMFADYGYIDILAPGQSQINVLNGEPDVDHYIALYYYGSDQTVDTLFVMNYNPGGIVSGALKSSVNVKVENITESSADMVFTPGQNTCGYVYRLFTNADFETYYQYGEEYGYIDPLEYIRLLVDAYGTRDYLARTDTRTALTVSTDYVLVCFPYNVNGTQGWGESVIYRFSTPEPASEAPTAAPAASEKLFDEKVEKLNKILGKKSIR